MKTKKIAVASLLTAWLLVWTGCGGGGSSTPPQPKVISITTTTLSDGVIGFDYSSTLSASNVGNSATWSIESGDLPPGLNLSGTGTTATIAGKPTQDGSFTFTIGLVDGTANTSRSLSIKINPPIEITTSSLPDGVLGQYYDHRVNASWTSPNASWAVSAGSFPQGLSLTPSPNWAQISGTPWYAGSYAFTLKLTDGQQSVTRDFTLNVVIPPLSITTTSPLPEASTGQSYNTYIQASPGTGIRTWSIIAGGLPPGISPYYSSYLGLSGWPTDVGTYNFTVQVVDGEEAATKDFTLRVNLDPLIITRTAVPYGTTGSSYWVELGSTGGTGPKTWSITAGTLPPGISLDLSTGTLSGTPSTIGAYTFTAQVQDSSGSASREFAMQVVDPLTVVITEVHVNVNTPASVQVQASGGLPPYQWRLVGGLLPPGISFTQDGVLEGSCGLPWDTHTVISVQDSLGEVRSSSLHVVVDGSMLIGNTVLPRAAIGTAYNVPLKVFGGTNPHTWSVPAGNLPAGLSLDASSGAITGTPTGPTGETQFTITVTDSSVPPQTASRDLGIRVQSSLGRNDSLETATFLYTNRVKTLSASLSPYADPVDVANPDTDYYRLTALANSYVTVQPYGQASADLIVELLDEGGNRLNICEYSGSQGACFADYHGSNPLGNGSYLGFAVPGNAEFVFYVHVLDYYGNARPDYQYSLTVSGAE